MRSVLAALTLSLGLPGCASIYDGLAGPDAATAHRGGILAQAKCATCHTISGGATSPNPRAPTFARIATLYSRNGLEWELEAISEIGHYDMPAMSLSRAEMRNIAAYIDPRHGPA